MLQVVKSIIVPLLAALFFFTPATSRGDYRDRAIGYSYEDVRHARKSYETISQPRRHQQSGSKITAEKKSSAPQASRKTVKAPSQKKAQEKVQQKGQGKHYTVRKGDTLFSVARRHGLTVTQLCSANGIAQNKTIYPGLKLKIPSPVQSAGPASGKGEAKHKNAPAFTWPVQRVVSYRPDGDKGVKSIGILITARPESPVHSAAGGVVKKVGQMRGYGRYVVIKHSERFMTVYSNLDGIVVQPGDRLDRGAFLGRLSSGDTLHFQIDCEGKPQNPLVYLPGNG
jgi:lipoprotein NlpD